MASQAPSDFLHRAKATAHRFFAPGVEKLPGEYRVGELPESLKVFTEQQGLNALEIQLGGGGESNQLGSPGKGLFPGDEGPAARSKSAAGDKDCRSILVAVPDCSSASPASRYRRPHHGHDPSPDCIGQAVPDGGQFNHLGRDHLGLHGAAQSVGLVGRRCSHTTARKGRGANCFAFCFALPKAVT